MSDPECDEEYEEYEEYVDIISELSPAFPHIIAQILEYLTVRELCLICCVCKNWQNVCLNSYNANKRRIKHLNKIRKLRRSVGQENWPIKRRTPVATKTRRDPFSDIRNVYRTRQSIRLSTHSTNISTTVANRDMGLRALR